MINQTRGIVSAALAAAAVALAPGQTGAQDDSEMRSYILATATTGGTYYPVGVAIATLVKVKLEPTMGFTMSAISSAGSGENIALMRDGDVQFAILQGLYGAWAADGSGDYTEEGPQTYIRSVGMLWPNVEHFVLLSDLAETGTIEDLAGIGDDAFAIGRQNSGTWGSGMTILTNLGIDTDAMNMVDAGGYTSTVEALQNRNIVGANIPAGVPVSAVTNAMASMEGEITVLDFTDEQMQRANGGQELWTRYEIPPETYPGQAEPIITIAQANFLAVREDVSEEDVYQTTKAMYENLAFLQNIHAATREMALETAIEGLPLPLHPGAARYFQEAGLTIPERLMPPAE